jgi:hypothetical protein
LSARRSLGAWTGVFHTSLSPEDLARGRTGSRRVDDDEEFHRYGKLDNIYGPSIICDGGRTQRWHRMGEPINPPAPADQIVGYAAGIDANVFDKQWARREGAALLGDDVIDFDHIHQLTTAGMNDSARVLAQRFLDNRG